MLKVGIVGLPNAGKSTLFNALVKGNQADVGNFPFCTIEPNVGIVEVPDTRLEELAAIVNPSRLVPAAVEFVDIAGLVAGANDGQGLGNKFLSHIREVDAITLVLRAFTDSNVIHVEGDVNPVRDYETLMLELTLADLQVASKLADAAARTAHDGKAENIAKAKAWQEIKETLDANRPISDLLAGRTLTPEFAQVLKEGQLLTAKPRLLSLNVADSDLADPLAHPQIKEWMEQGRTVSEDFDLEHALFISARVESELNTLDAADQAVFLAEFGLTEPGLHRLIRQAYHRLGLHSFFTAGPMEVRAWTIPQGATAPEAAGVIHTDFAERFIRAEVIAYEDFIKHRGEGGAREAGRLRSEGKEYVVQDGDVLHIRFAPK